MFLDLDSSTSKKHPVLEYFGTMLSPKITKPNGPVNTILAELHYMTDQRNYYGVYVSLTGIVFEIDVPKSPMAMMVVISKYT